MIMLMSREFVSTLSQNVDTLTICSYLTFISIWLRATLTLLVRRIVMMASMRNDHGEGVDFRLVIDLCLAFMTSALPIGQLVISI